MSCKMKMFFNGMYVAMSCTISVVVLPPIPPKSCQYTFSTESSGEATGALIAVLNDNAEVEELCHLCHTSLATRPHPDLSHDAAFQLM